MQRHGIPKGVVHLSDDAIREIITCYTRESGVRNLERELAAVCRKCAMRLVEDNAPKRIRINGANLDQLLGPRKFLPDELPAGDTVGLVTGLAWTAVGGETLEVEVNVVDGTGKLELTGNLGDVMKESVYAAMSYIRSRTAQYYASRPTFIRRRTSTSISRRARSPRMVRPPVSRSARRSSPRSPARPCGVMSP